MKSNRMKSSGDDAKTLIELVDTILSNLDPKPVMVSDEFPLRWESGIFIDDYDFSVNYLDLDEQYERSGGEYLQSAGSAIEIIRRQNGGYEYWDGIYMTETHAWCSKLNSKEDFPSYSLVKKKFRNLDQLKKFLTKSHG